ncbi:MAG: FKBP-type peptidyl-prolyl cis-trans isomerase, partial [Deltaproteobacteria bacterium]|nr:FKBP-type peptidyl-prolyl cis-trans isomerase [Deltaproteobacteria bacterium]
MRMIMLILVNAFVMVGSSFAENQMVENQKDRVNYSVGYQIGGDFKSQGMALNPELLVKGIQDALFEKEPLMTPKEMRHTLIDFKEKIMAAEALQKQQDAEQNLTEGKKFLAENAKKEGVKTLPSGLQYRILEEGEGEPPKPTDMVTVHYRGTLIDGTEFDSSYNRNEPATFRADRVIKGWKEALQLMKPGANYQLFIPPDLAYGERGGGSKIGPNRTLIFEVKLLSIQKEQNK